jgi:LCP family protein required for cell wall assembly
MTSRPKKKRARWVAAGVALVILSIVGYLGWDMSRTASTIYEQLPSRPDTMALPPLSGGGLSDQQVIPNGVDEHMEQEAYAGHALPVSGSRRNELEVGQSFCMLLLGIDERSGDKGRSDTIMLVAVNPVTRKAMIVQLQRDSRVQIAGLNRFDKLNHAYAYGGVGMSVATVEDFLGVPVSYYIQTNMEGFSDVVDIIGKVEATNDRSFRQGKRLFPKGQVLLDGPAALDYVRMRKDDPQGDFGRMDRQRNVLLAVVKKAASVSHLPRLPQLLKEVRDNVRTNLTAVDIRKLVLDVYPRIQLTDKQVLRGKGAKINGIYYQLITQQERQQMHDRLTAFMQVSQ